MVMMMIMMIDLNHRPRLTPMRPRMIHQVIVPTESLSTKITLVLLNTAMNARMAYQFIASGKPLGALATLVRFLARVNPFVPDQVSVVKEPLAAHFAFVVPFTYVYDSIG